MIALSKRWAIASGFAVVAGAAAVQIVTSHFYDSNPLAGASNFFSPQTQSAAVPSNPALSVPVTAAATPVPAAVKPQAPAAAAPHFDVVRVEPDGGTVVAGQGAPDSSVALLSSGKVIGEAKADSTGHFALVPSALPPGGTTLTLRQSSGGVTVDSHQSVAVAVPEKGQDKGGLVVALTEPGQAIKLLAAPRSTPAPPPAAAVPAATASGTTTAAVPAAVSAPAKPSPGPAPAIAIRSVELENGNGFFASGLAVPGTKLGIYLNNSHIADVVAGADSSWSLKLKKGLTPGHYSVRADASADGKTVTSRAEVPFDVPASAPAAANSSAVTLADASPGTASPVAATATTPPPPVTTPANAVIAEIKTTVVRSGDNLWDISRVQLGEGARYTRIYAANSAQIRNPDLIYPGQVFVVPTQNN